AAVPRHRRHLRRSWLPGGAYLAEPRARAVPARSRRGPWCGAAEQGASAGAGDRELSAAVLPEERHDRVLRAGGLGVGGGGGGWPGGGAGGEVDSAAEYLFRGVGH